MSNYTTVKPGQEIRRNMEIAGLLCTLTAVAQAFPELRVGQLIMNTLKQKDDLYYISDDELAERIIEYGNKYLKGVPA